MNQWHYELLYPVTIFAIGGFQIIMLAKAFENKMLALQKSKILESNNHLFDRVEKVMTKLLESNQDDENIRKKNWTISVVEDKQANAYVNNSANGRITITINTGMLEICDNDDKLAFVLGHEMAHIMQKHLEIWWHDKFLAHSISSFSKSICRYKGHMLFRIIWKIIFASYFLNPLFLKGLLWDLSYSRQNEREADEIGLKLSSKAHFNVEEGPLFWDKIDKKLKVFPEYFETHPSCKKRSQHLKTLIQKPLLVKTTIITIHKEEQSYEVEVKKHDYHREFLFTASSNGPTD